MTANQKSAIRGLWLFVLITLGIIASALTMWTILLW
jgi:hypothetical protein